LLKSEEGFSGKISNLALCAKKKHCIALVLSLVPWYLQTIALTLLVAIFFASSLVWELL
jgi:hypothetical protein